MKWTDENIVESIRDGREEGLVALYQWYKPEFISWAKQTYQIDESKANDAFQDAVIALRANVVNDRYEIGASALKTYLFAIGKNKLLYRFKKERKEMHYEDLSQAEYLETPAWEKQALSSRASVVKQAMVKLGEPCLSILKMYYYQNFSMDVIAARMNYKNHHVVKSQKVRCMQRLKSMSQSAEQNA